MVRRGRGHPERAPARPVRFDPEWDLGPVRALSGNPDRILDLLVGEKPSGVKSRTDALGPLRGPLGRFPRAVRLFPPPRRASMEPRTIRPIPGHPQPVDAVDPIESRRAPLTGRTGPRAPGRRGPGRRPAPGRPGRPAARPPAPRTPPWGLRTLSGPGGPAGGPVPRAAPPRRARPRSPRSGRGRWPARPGRAAKGRTMEDGPPARPDASGSEPRAGPLQTRRRGGSVPLGRRQPRRPARSEPRAGSTTNRRPTAGSGGGPRRSHARGGALTPCSSSGSRAR